MMASEKKISYVKRHFLILFLMVVMLVGIMGAAIIRFSKGVVGNEIIKLHQALLNQSANGTADALGSLKEVLTNITQNAGVTRWLSEEAKESGADDAVDVVDGLIQDEIYKGFKRGNIFRIYVYDLEGLRFGSDHPVIPWETAVDLIGEAAPLGEDIPGSVYLKGPVRTEEDGLYRHSYYLIEPVKDLISNRVEGYVLMQFSEKILYDTYSDMRGKDRKYCIIKSDGTLVSGENKSEIGGMPQIGRPVLEAKGQTAGGIIPEDGHQTVTDGGQEYMYFYENILGTDWYLMERINVHEIWETLDTVGYFSLCLIAAFVLCLYPLTAFSKRHIIKPVDEIKDKMNQVAEGDLSVRIGDAERGKGEFAEIADSFNYMVDRLEKQVEEIRAIDHKKHLLELDFLQAQINPHFIYNTLSSIRFYVEMGKNEEAEDMLIDFSKILRKTLSRTEQLITLREEIETLRHYVNLQRARYREKVEVEFAVEENTLPALVPDFILQPIVENAIFYSLKEEKVCHIRIKSYLDGTDLCVSVKDDGIGMNEEKINTVLNKDMNMNKVGLKNVNERLKLNYGDDYGLKIISEEGKGTEVVLVMPSTAERKRQR